MSRFTGDCVDRGNFAKKIVKRGLIIQRVFKRIKRRAVRDGVLGIFKVLKRCFFGFEFALKSKR